MEITKASFLPHQQRVIEESEQLHEKISNLGALLTTKAYFNLPTQEQVRLLEQIDTMSKYHSILCERVAWFIEEMRNRIPQSTTLGQII